MPPKKSSIHSHYQEEMMVDKNTGRTITQRLCRHCGDLYAIGSSTDTLTKHYDRNHQGKPPPFHRFRRSCEDEPATKRQCTSTQSTLDKTIMRLSNDDLLPAMASLWAHCSWAHRIVQLPQFLAVASALRASNIRIPTRDALRTAQLSLAQSLRTRVVRQLRNYCNSDPLTIAIDGWTNVNTAKVTNVLILCGGEAYYWCSIVNANHRNTANWLCDPLVKVMNDIKAEGLVFSALVADNERVNHALWEQVLEPFPFLIRSPCAAHLVQLCVIKALALPGIEGTLMAMDELLGKFRLKVHRLQLKEVQLAAKKTVLNLLRPCETRWSSQLQAAARLYMLKSFVDLVIEQPPQFWVNIQQIIEFLKPFQVATDVMQRDGSTLYDTYSQFKALLTHAGAIKSSSVFYPVRHDIIDIILDMWEKHININAIICCAILSFDPSVSTTFTPSQIHTAEQWFFSFAAKYAQAWTLSTTIDYERLRREVKSQWGNFMARAAGSTFSTFSSDIEDLRERHAEEKRDFDPRAVWHHQLRHAPTLAYSAVALLSVAASEAAVERSFSAQGDVHSDRRNRLADVTVEAEMFIKFNEATVLAVEQWEEEKKSKQKKGQPVRKRKHVVVPNIVMEMGEDADEEEIVERAVNVRSLFSRPEREAAAEEGEEAPVAAGEEEEQKEDEPVAAARVSAVPPPADANDTEAFIRSYVKEFSITASYRWQGHHMQQLEAAGMAWTPRMRDGPVALKKMIKEWVKNRAEDEEEEKEEEEEPEAAAELSSMLEERVNE